MKKLICIVFAVVLMLGVSALADGQLKLMQAKQIEGTDDVRLYVNADEAPTQENTSVYLNGAKLDTELQVQPVADMQAGTVYVFCVDVSGTINADDLDAACAEMTSFCEQLGEADLMRIYVIGTGATPICDYTRDVEVVKQALKDMPRRTNKTYLWEAVRIAADDLTANRGNLPELAQIIVFSDCVDDSDQTGSVEQTLDSVQQAGMPLRVVMMNSKEKDPDLSPIEWLCEKSGGVIFDGRGSFTAGLDDLHGEMNNDFCVTLPGVPYDLLQGTGEWFVQQRIGKEMHASNIMSCELKGVNAPAIHGVNYAYAGDVPEGAPELPGAMLYRVGDPVEVAAAPRMAGYAFSGWSTGNFTMPDEDVTITGSWTPNRHRVVYTYSGTVPEGAPEAPAFEEYGFGESVVVAGNPEMAGYTFSGWGQTEFTMPDSDVVVSGMWVPNRHRVRYSYGGVAPAGAPALPESSTYNFGDIVPVAQVPTMVGYTFSGWNTGDFAMPDEDVTITGEWVANQHEVSYSYTGNIPANVPAPAEAATFSYGQTVTVASFPEMEGYTFQGWSADGIELDKDGGFTMPDAHVAFTGSWAVNYHDISFAYDDTAPEDAPEQTGETHAYGETVMLPAPTAVGHTFQGWSAEGVEVDGNGLFTMPDSDVAFAGGWTLNHHDVSFAYAGTVPEGAPEAPATSSVAYGDTVTPEAPTFTGYTFDGWMTADGTAAGSSFTMPDDDVALIGSWSPLPVENARFTREGDEINPDDPLKIDSDSMELHLQAEGAIQGMQFTAAEFDGRDITDQLISVSPEDPATVIVHREAMEADRVYTITGTVAGVNPQTPQTSVTLNVIRAEKKKLWPILAIGGGVLLLAALAALLLTRRKKAESEVTVEAAVIEDEDPLEKTSTVAPQKEVHRKHVVRRVRYIETIGDSEPNERAQVIDNEALIGRDSECEIFYKGDTDAERTVSHKHAKFTLDSAGHLFIEPYPGTVNPTMVDGKEIDEPTPVEPDTEIRMGDVVLKVTAIGQVEKN